MPARDLTALSHPAVKRGALPVAMLVAALIGAGAAILTVGDSSHPRAKLATALPPERVQVSAPAPPATPKALAAAPASARSQALAQAPAQTSTPVAQAPATAVSAPAHQRSSRRQSSVPQVIKE